MAKIENKLLELGFVGLDISRGIRFKQGQIMLTYICLCSEFTLLEKLSLEMYQNGVYYLVLLYMYAMQIISTLCQSKFN